jgi:hypothetical protein
MPLWQAPVDSGTERKDNWVALPRRPYETFLPTPQDSPPFRVSSSPAQHVCSCCKRDWSGGAGVGVPSEATIIYTAAHVNIGVNPYDLDLNHDGITDFIFRNGISCDPARCLYSLVVYSPHGVGNAVAFRGGRFPRFLAQALSHGAVIGSGRSFATLVGMASATYSGGGELRERGHWVNVTDRYLGVEFSIKGRTHYGWARLTVKVKHPFMITAVLTGYAYETIPNKRIFAGKTRGPNDATSTSGSLSGSDDSGRGAYLTNPIPDTPQPASLGMLAVGSRGVPLWRRKDSALKGD